MKLYTNLTRVKFQNPTTKQTLVGLKINHTMNFSTIYLPGTIKDIRLYFRATIAPSSYLDMNYKRKILVKQSYILLVWMHYLASSSSNNSLVEGSETKVGTSTTNIKVNPIEEEDNVRIPSFFIYPRRNYRTTIQKAPMAHKTFSQEQYLIRFYKLSITFSVGMPSSIANKKDFINDNRLLKQVYPTQGVNNILFYSFFLLKSMPVFSTNIL